MDNEPHKTPEDAVIDAWCVEGPAPGFHRQWVRRLAREWPTLADALDALTESRDREPPRR